MKKEIFRIFLIQCISLSVICEYKLNASVNVIPHINKRAKGGEDAHYINPKMIAVADGVGGWATKGVDPAIYSRRLCKNIGDIYLDENILSTKNDPKELLIKAAQDIPNTIEGSSTCVIAMLDTKNSILHTANLGDSGFMLIRTDAASRELRIIYRSQEQVHGFNFPFQVGTNGDAPQKAHEFVHQIEFGDILIVAKRYIGKIDLDVNLCAEQIAKQANIYSLKREYLSPFSKRAQVEMGYHGKGGKEDDITVVVAQIIQS